MEQQIKSTPIERWITNPLNRWASKSTSGGIVLFLAALIAIFMANSPWAEWYHHLWEHKIGFGFDNELFLNLSLHHWVNDGLMAVFFFVVGLELKRELTSGELSSPKKAMLPIIAAIGGMVVPALIYTFFAFGTDAAHGWGIPMATDIAFALGVLHLLGDRVPVSLKVFLTALAIADDLGAVLVIAIFYTSELSMMHLGIGLGFFLVLVISNIIGIKNVLYYAIIGIVGVWLAFLLSGVHATIAAVLVAFAIPSTARVGESYFVQKMNLLRDRFRGLDPKEKISNLTTEQVYIVEEMDTLCTDVIPLSYRLEHGMHGFVSFVVMPVFALANAAIPISMGEGGGLSYVTMGVALGLLLGKVIGVSGLTALLIKTKLVKMPEGMTYTNLFGLGFLAAIGFTMSLFVTELAFDAQLHPEYPGQAKLGILIASGLGGLIGFLLLNRKAK
ncbi:Na+/H+ antiporter NhaA [Flavobacterium sp. HSC-61S13]|uniref:Na+/H+ antiporter NhaA n=1 Tax=Flavobacterium sp. HSC-61S13 TaxID=2910963 RepID=UPI00209EF1CA|nr:Na+/H+ antiporter NhaA [Flavobacterium sp. HSC-61S13]MCP1995532.1 NhaA family Na+:H+ antiporter [Flavobacterium sp. HSC-61S13]